MYGSLISMGMGAGQAISGYFNTQQLLDNQVEWKGYNTPLHAKKYVQEAERVRDDTISAYREAEELALKRSTRSQEQTIGTIREVSRTPSELAGGVSATNYQKTNTDLGIRSQTAGKIAEAQTIPFQSYMELAKYENLQSEMKWKDYLLDRQDWKEEYQMAAEQSRAGFENITSGLMSIQPEIRTGKYYDKVSENLDAQTELLKKELNPEYGLDDKGDVDTTFKDKDTTSTDTSSPEYDSDKITNTDISTETKQAESKVMQVENDLNIEHQKIDNWNGSEIYKKFISNQTSHHSFFDYQNEMENGNRSYNPTEAQQRSYLKWLISKGLKVN